MFSTPKGPGILSGTGSFTLRNMAFDRYRGLVLLHRGVDQHRSYVSVVWRQELLVRRFPKKFGKM